jgi:hypothetical protein
MPTLLPEGIVIGNLLIDVVIGNAVSAAPNYNSTFHFNANLSGKESTRTGRYIF